MKPTVQSVNIEIYIYKSHVLYNMNDVKSKTRVEIEYKSKSENHKGVKHMLTKMIGNLQ